MKNIAKCLITSCAFIASLAHGTTCYIQDAAQTKNINTCDPEKLREFLPINGVLVITEYVPKNKLKTTAVGRTPDGSIPTSITYTTYSKKGNLYTYDREDKGPGCKITAKETESDDIRTAIYVSSTGSCNPIVINAWKTLAERGGSKSRKITD